MTKIDSAASALADRRPTLQKKAPHAAVSRHLILDVAAGLFAEKGFAETTMRQIAAKAGIKTIDVGVPQLAMHSIREMCGVIDLVYYERLFATFMILHERLLQPVARSPGPMNRTL